MLLAYCVYFFILIIVPGFAWCTIHSRQRDNFRLCRWDVMMPVLTVSLLMGFRYNVGTDWEQYFLYYTNILQYGISWQEIICSTLEPLYWLLNAGVAFFNLPYQLFFAIIMFLHLMLLYKSFDRYVFLLPFGLFFYFTTVFFTSLNIQRQTLSFCIFLFALRYLVHKQMLKYFLCIVVASLFHYSAIVLFPIYFLTLKWAKILDHRGVMLILYALSFLLFDYFLNLFVNVALQYLTNAKYSQNLSLLGNWNMGVSSGLGILASHTIDIILILFSGTLGRVYRNSHFTILFRIFFIGMFLANVFGVDVFLSRVPFAMENLRFLILAFLVYYLFNVKKNVLYYCLGIGIMLLYLSMFIVGIHNSVAGCSPFMFA